MLFFEIGLFGVGSHNGPNLGLNIISKSHWLYGIGASFGGRTPENLPKGFQAGLLISKKIEKATSLTLLFGKVMYVENRAGRFRLMGGPSFTTIQNPINYTRISGTKNLFGPTHEYDINKIKRFSLTLEPTIDMGLGRGFAFSFKSQLVYVPKYATIIRFTFTISLGKVYLRRHLRDNYIPHPTLGNE